MITENVRRSRGISLPNRDYVCASQVTLCACCVSILICIECSALFCSLSLCRAARQRQFLDPELTEEGLSSLISEFVEDAHQAAPASRGWLGTTYGNSKAGANQLAAVLARNMGRYTKAEDVLINACCPGWCKTDMAGWERPPKTAEQGAETPVFLATLPPGAGLSGRYAHAQGDMQQGINEMKNA
uniref:Uncharacterized protein n=1 Tax=Chromera velia CCMP2878 TaxID=1169474 RepID=A0A0G4HN81_9ALVE|eukprot:Cvel_1196.t1-p1 / transcript=Cvel_1196.t1 / gene=Cvel_1196 / organism=Chromera_velia_CCMP2878 / gene_product=Carbonyl reductase [NADPH] 1, putative / transcript_product=Carbonyl reductase [NADPH] 1, putative / location=Cvel_scaffold39:169446-172089(-) / protein_length=185 / sequence_SO=supercontig / SO=protein_coding / is_pseudo=false